MHQRKNSISLYSGFAEEVRQFGIKDAARRIAARGFSSVEMLEMSKTPEGCVFADIESATEAREILSYYGITLSCYSLTARLWTPEMTEDYVKATDKRIRHFASVAAALDAPCFHHLIAPASDGTPYEVVLETVLPRLISHIDFAASLGLKVLYEPQGPYFNGCEGFGTLYRTLKAETAAVGVCGDMGNPVFTDENPVSFFEAFAGEMLHVHMKDYRLHTESGHETKCGDFVQDAVIGEGDLDLPACLSALRKANYRGAFSIEHRDPRSCENAKALLHSHFYA